LKILLESDQVDAVMVIAPPPPMYPVEDMVSACLPAIKSKNHKPVVFSLLGSEQVEAGVALLRENKVPEYNFPEKAASALGALWKRVQIVEANGKRKTIDFEIDSAAVDLLLNQLGV